MDTTKRNRKKAGAGGKKRTPPGITSRELTNPVKSKASIRSRIRPIGNSKGVILSNHIIEAAGLNAAADIVIQAADGVIYILQLKTPEVNTDLSTWDKQFKEAIKTGNKPDDDLFNGMANEFDSKEW